MSPEQCRGRDVDHRTDIYAFGIVTPTTCSPAVLPFPGDDYMEILLAQINEEPAPPSTHAPDLPAGIDQVIAWMMAKDPSMRPASLKTAVQGLEQAARAGGVALPTGPPGTDGGMQPVVIPDTMTPPIERSGIGSAPTVAPGQTVPAPIAAKRKGGAAIWVALASVLLAGAVVVVIVLSGSGDEQPQAKNEVPTPPQEPLGQPPEQPPPEVPAKPTLVTLTFSDSVPNGTVISVLGREYGVLSSDLREVQIPYSEDPAIVTLSSPGYRPGSTKLTPSADQQVDKKLKKQRGRKARRLRDRAAGKDGRDGRDGEDKRNRIEDPFKKKK